MTVRILHLTSTKYGIGGVERLLLDMADKFDSRLFDISYSNLLCERNGKGVFPQAIKNRNLSYFDIQGKHLYELPKLIFNLRKLIQREKFDIVHAHMFHATIVGNLAARTASKTSKKLVTRHYTNDATQHHGKLIQQMDNYLTANADQVVAVSEAVKKDLAAQGILESKIAVIHNGTDIALFDRMSSEEINLPLAKRENFYIIGSVGSLTKRKGQRYLIEALPLILEKEPDVRLVIAGEGPEKDLLIKLSKELNLEDKIFFAGFQKNVPALLKHFDLYVHPSIEEPFGIALLEAMAAQKCVVGSNVDGIPEIIREGETGYLVAKADKFQLAETVCFAVSNSAKTKQMGIAGRKRVEETFNLDKTVSKYETLYLTLKS